MRVNDMLTNLSTRGLPDIETLTSVSRFECYMGEFRIPRSEDNLRIPPPTNLPDKCALLPEVYIMAIAPSTPPATKVTSGVGGINCGNCVNCVNPAKAQACEHRGLFDAWDLRHCETARGEYPVMYGVYTGDVMVFSEFGEVRRRGEPDKGSKGRIVK
jgi:hypothetical protein